MYISYSSQPILQSLLDWKFQGEIIKESQTFPSEEAFDLVVKLLNIKSLGDRKALRSYTKKERKHLGQLSLTSCKLGDEGTCFVAKGNKRVQGTVNK